MTIIPFGMPFKDWADQMSVEIMPFGPPPTIADTDNWQFWAQEVVGIPAIGRLQPPDPFMYDQWEDWATTFIALFSTG